MPFVNNCDGHEANVTNPDLHQEMTESVVIARETVHTTQPDADSNGVTTQPGLAKWLNRSAASCRNSRRHPYGNSTDGSDSK